MTTDLFGEVPEIPKAESYRPSNGSEGEWFYNLFCTHCLHEQDESDPCPIIAETMAFDIGDPSYPKAWVYDRNGDPTCTQYKDLS